MQALYLVSSGLWSPADIDCKISNEAEYPEDLKNFIKTFSEQNKANFNEDDFLSIKAGVESCSADNSRLLLEFKKVSWAQIQAVQKNLDSPVLDGKTIRDAYYKADVPGVLPNQLGTNWAPVNENLQQILLQIRAVKGMDINQGTLSVPGGNMLLADASPAVSGARELEEEINLANSEMFAFGFVRHNKTGHYNIIGEAVTTENLEDVAKNAKSEEGTFFVAPLNYRGFCDSVKNYSKLSPAGFLAACISVARRCNETEKEDFYRLLKEQGKAEHADYTKRMFSKRP